MQQISIRPAKESDIVLLRQFEQGVISAERPYDVTLKKDMVQYYDLEAMLANKNVHLVIAEDDGKAVGCGYCRIEDAKPYLSHKQHGYLGFMYVLPAYRGKGINKILINSLAAWAISKNIRELRLDVYFQNETAIRAYQK